MTKILLHIISALTLLMCLSTADAQMVSSFAGKIEGGSEDGTGAAAGFSQPKGLVLDAAGNIYAVDIGNNTIRKITPAGVVSTLAGSGNAGYADGQGTNASFDAPCGIAIDASGNLYVTELTNNRVRKITPSGLVSTLAGSGVRGDLDGQGINADLGMPAGIALDASGNVYITELWNAKIRKITPTGLVTTYAGTGIMGNADGALAVAQFNNPYALAFDLSGNLFVADMGNNSIRKITPAGMVTTFAGGSQGNADGQGTSASFHNPIGLAIGHGDTVYVVDSWNHSIRRITRFGKVSTMAGHGSIGSEDGLGWTAGFHFPFSIVVGSEGILYVGDEYNNLIRKINLNQTTLTGVMSSRMNSAEIAVYPNPSSSFITISAEHHLQSYEILNASGVLVKQGDLNSSNTLDISTFSPGLYLLKVTTDQGYATQTLIKE